MSGPITKEALLELLEKRKADLIPKLIAAESERTRGQIHELQILIKKITEQL